MAPEWLTNSLKKVAGFSDPGPVFIQKTNAGNAALKRGRPDEAEPLFKDALTEAEKFGEQDLRKVAAMNNLATAYGGQGKHSEAESLFRQAIAIHEKALGPAHPEVIAALGEKGRAMTWAISGCGNSCAQPQLADAGILAVKSVKGEDGRRQPLFDLLRREDSGFGHAVRQGLSFSELLQAVADLG